MSEELTSIFAAMEVSCAVKEDSKKGKHVVALKSMKGNTVLFEEVPIVCWSFASRPSGSYCDWCLISLDPELQQLLNQQEQQKQQQNNNKNQDSSSSYSRKIAKVKCGGEHEKEGCVAVYCSPECAAKAKNSHFFLCGEPLKKIRAFDSDLLLQQRKQHQQQEASSSSSSSSSSSTSAATSASSAVASEAAPTSSSSSSSSSDILRKIEQEDEDGGLPITLEALARSIASVAVRYFGISQQNPEATPDQLFPTAAKNFNRLLGCPDDADYDGVDAPKWFEAIRDSMNSRLMSVLNNAQVVEALTKNETLNTMIGQLALNSQALNLPVVVSSSSCGNEDGEEEEEEEQKKNNSNNNEKKIIRPSVGAAVFALHSALNHSCDPNAFVVFGQDHEIAVKLKKGVEEGEEITITYISELFLKLEDFKARRERLKNYFFTCACHRCLSEESKSAGVQQNQNQNQKECEEN